MSKPEDFTKALGDWAEPLLRGAGAGATGPDWEALRTHPALSGPEILQDAAQEGNTALTEALARYHTLMAGAASRTAHRYAEQATALPEATWQERQDLWFRIAETEFIEVQNSDAFCGVLRAVFKAAAAQWSSLPQPTREAARTWFKTTTDMRHALGGAAARVGTTPKAEIWREGQVSVARYQREGGATLGPVLLCHGLIGRQTMLDLQPDRSLVRRLLSAGADVYALDWGNAAGNGADCGLDHIVGHLIPEAVRAALGTAKAPDLTLFGICQGGTLAACHAARAGHGLNGLILGVAPIDFHAVAPPEHSVLTRWLRALDPDDIAALTRLDATLSGALMGLIFNHLNPVRTLRKYAVTLPGIAQDQAALETFVAMETWLADRPDLPGTLAREWLIELYHHNRLIGGTLKIAGDAVDLGRIDVPVLSVFGENDHIVPAPSTRAIARFIPPERCTECALPSGHIGAFVSRRSLERLSPAVIAWLEKHTRRGL